MPEVKPKRPYDSSLRKEQANQTRMRILDTAQSLFAARGYPASTIEAIAAGSGVAVDTVYAAFGSKRGVLQALLNVRVGGDEAELDLLDRAGPQAVQREPDQKAQLAAFAADVSAIVERARPVDDVIRGAAAVDADIAAFRSEAQAYRYRNMRQLAHPDPDPDLSVPEHARAGFVARLEWAARRRAHGRRRRGDRVDHDQPRGALAASCRSRLVC